MNHDPRESSRQRLVALLVLACSFLFTSVTTTAAQGHDASIIGQVTERQWRSAPRRNGDRDRSCVAGQAVSANFEPRSGDPWARQVSFSGGTTIPQIRLRVEPIGARRLPNLNILSMRVEKSFPLLETHTLALQANIYNALNINKALGVTPLSGPNFLIPTSIAAADRRAGRYVQLLMMPALLLTIS